MPKKLDLKPPFHWPGGKSRALKFLEPFLMSWPSTYCEPFLGSGTVFLAIQPKQAFLSDASQEVIDAWENIKDNIDELTQELHSLMEIREITKKFYLAKRNEFNDLKKIHISNLSEYQFVRRSALFLFLNKMCFKGLYKLNLDGSFKGTFGTRKSFTFDLVNLREISKYLNDNDINFACFDYKEAMATFNNESFGGRGSYWFIDPPYDESVKLYGPKAFTAEDQQELAGWCQYLKNMKACILLITNRNTEFIKSLYPSFTKKFYDIQILVSSESKNRDEKQEMLMHNIPSN